MPGVKTSFKRKSWRSSDRSGEYKGDIRRAFRDTQVKRWFELVDKDVPVPPLDRKHVRFCSSVVSSPRSVRTIMQGIGFYDMEVEENKEDVSDMDQAENEHLAIMIHHAPLDDATTSPVLSTTSPVPSPTSPVPSPTSPVPSTTSPVPSPTSPVPSPTSPGVSTVGRTYTKTTVCLRPNSTKRCFQDRRPWSS